MLSATTRLLKPTLKPAARCFASSAMVNKEIKRMTVFGAGQSTVGEHRAGRARGKRTDLG
jgi:hypothetical protein